MLSILGERERSHYIIQHITTLSMKNRHHKSVLVHNYRMEDTYAIMIRVKVLKVPDHTNLEVGKNVVHGVGAWGCVCNECVHVAWEARLVGSARLKFLRGGKKQCEILLWSVHNYAKKTLVMQRDIVQGWVEWAFFTKALVFCTNWTCLTKLRGGTPQTLVFLTSWFCFSALGCTLFPSSLSLRCQPSELLSQWLFGPWYVVVAGYDVSPSVPRSKVACSWLTKHDRGEHVVKRLCACAERETQEMTGNYGERFTVIHIAHAPVARLAHVRCVHDVHKCVKF